MGQKENCLIYLILRLYSYNATNGCEIVKSTIWFKTLDFDTSRTLTYKNDSAEHVVDINAAVNYLLEQKRKA